MKEGRGDGVGERKGGEVKGRSQVAHAYLCVVCCCMCEADRRGGRQLALCGPIFAPLAPDHPQAHLPPYFPSIVLSAPRHTPQL
jgi:hypothetical protein